MSNEDAVAEVRLEKVVSGGQTGVDRAALDAALRHGVDVGGWCPRGRRAEDGRIDDRYPLTETPAADYAERTAWNVRDSDGTLVVALGEPSGGTAITVDVARRMSKPCLIVDPAQTGADEVRLWIDRHRIRTLNVAGPRESEEGGIYERAYAFLDKLLGNASSRRGDRPSSE